MGLKSWIAEKLNPAQPYIASQDPYNVPQSIVDYKTAFREIEVVHRSIEMVINALVSIPFVVDGGAAKKINKLLNVKPNPFEDRVRLFRRAFLDFYLDGNAFFYYDKESLYLLPANDVEVVADSKTFISHYNYLIYDQQTDWYGFAKETTRDAKITFTPDEIVQVKSDNDQSIFRGDSKLKNLQRLFELYYELLDFQRQFFKNNAIPGLVLKTDNVLSSKIKERMLESWRASYSNIFNGARSPAILDGGLDIDRFSEVKFNELDFENSVERIQMDIAKAIGVPYVLLKSGNNANIAANEVLFYNHTILPVLNQFCSAFEHFFNNATSILPDKRSVSALQPDLRTQAQYYSTLVNTGIITPDEARGGLGMGAMNVEETNCIRVPQNITGSATDPSQGGRPSEDEIQIITQDDEDLANE